MRRMARRHSLGLATSLGAGGMRAEVITGLALSLNGNAITVGHGLADEIASHGGSADHGARSTAQALASYLKGGNHQVTLATAHTFSCHTVLLRRTPAAGGLHPLRCALIRTHENPCPAAPLPPHVRCRWTRR